jgi:putative ABC transport system permease protein
MVWRSLIREPARLLLGTLTVAAAVALILIFEGFRAGLHEQVSAFPRNLPADLVATQAGVSNVLGSRSVLPQGARAAIEAVPGVRTAHPLTGLPLIYSQGSRASPIYVVAYDTAGGPRHLLAGHQIADRDEVVIDAALARKFQLAPGDSVDFLGHRFTVAGLSADTSNFFDPYVFVRLVDLVDLFLAGAFADLPLDPGLSFLLVEVRPGADPMTVAAEIERRVDAVDVFTPAALALNDERRVDEFLGPALSLLTGVAFAAGVLVVGLTLYVSVLGRVREFGVMRALGAGSGLLTRHVLVEAVIVSTLALAVGVVLAAATAALIHAAMPEYLVRPLDARAVARTVIAVVAMAGLGAVLPIRRLARVDPASVFSR